MGNSCTAQCVYDACLSVAFVFRPVALTSLVMKSFEKLVKAEETSPLCTDSSNHDVFFMLCYVFLRLLQHKLHIGDK